MTKPRDWTRGRDFGKSCSSTSHLRDRIRHRQKTLALLLDGQKGDRRWQRRRCPQLQTPNTLMSVHVEFKHATPTYLSECISEFCVMPQLHYTPWKNAKLWFTQGQSSKPPLHSAFASLGAFMRGVDSLFWAFEWVTKCAALQQTAIKLFYVIEVNPSTLQELLLGPKRKSGLDQH